MDGLYVPDESHAVDSLRKTLSPPSHYIVSRLAVPCQRRNVKFAGGLDQEAMLMVVEGGLRQLVLHEDLVDVLSLYRLS